MVVEAEWNAKELTHNGGRSSNSEMTNLSTSKTTRFLKSHNKEKILKLNQLVLPITMVKSTRNGRLSLLDKTVRLLPRERMKNKDSISTDHSTSDLECQ